MVPKDRLRAPETRPAPRSDASGPAEVLAAAVLVPAPLESWLERLLDRVEQAR